MRKRADSAFLRDWDVTKDFQNFSPFLTRGKLGWRRVSLQQSFCQNGAFLIERSLHV